MYGGILMGRKRLPEDERKEQVNIRLPKWVIDKIKEMGSLQEIIETLIIKTFKK